MKAIFLDIDGVLNNSHNNPKFRSKSHCGIYTGIDKDKVKRLAKIVQETGADLILISTWKVGWEKKGIYPKEYHYKICDAHAKYLDNHLQKKGKLFIKDKTRERNLAQRGTGIKSFLTLHPEYTEWIVLDDELFPDYDKKILKHLVKTNGQWGLQDDDADVAIKMLMG